MPNYHIWKQMDAHAEDFVAKGWVSSDRLNIAKEALKSRPESSLCEIFVNAGFITKQRLTEFIGTTLDVPVVDPSASDIDPQVIACIPAYLARQHKLLPFQLTEDRLLVVMADPGNQVALTELQSTYPHTIEICIGIDEKISQAIAKHYAVKNLTQPSTISVGSVNYLAHEKVADKANVPGENVVNVVNNLLIYALEEKASDIHLDPIMAGLKVRFRIDGTIYEMETLDRSIQMPVISRIKVMAELDMAERRIPQDGRARVQVGNKIVDLRIATYPAMWGEKVSIRILTKNIFHSLEGLGLAQGEQNTLYKIIMQPHGLFLVTGPTGSGKTTTLYSSFMKINRMDKHAISIEDPIENEILGVNQAQVNIKAGVTFSTALRSMLRHDPDIILVGEIRDTETADITARAAMTGHLVFSTLHTNSAVGAINRLLDLGLPPYLISSSLIGVMGQRLIRKICVHCKTEYEPSDDEKKSTGEKVSTYYHGAGCDNCRQTGYAGRTGIYEMLAINDEIRDMIGRHLNEQEIFDELKRKGFRTMWDDGIVKVTEGTTTITEVLRACRNS